MLIIDIFGEEPTVDTDEKRKDKEEKLSEKDVPFVTETLQELPVEIIKKIM